MPFPTHRPRRSRRLAGIVRTPSEDGSAPPRKSARTEQNLQSKQRRTLRNRRPSDIVKVRKTSLLSLPDEALSHILHLLGATNTGGSFQGPRHAFALARANTRLLHLFKNLITRITPDVNNNSPPSLSPRHICAVSRLAADNLREVHLPAGGCKIVPELYDACSKLKVLSVVDDDDVYGDYIRYALQFPVHSLAVDYPSADTLRSLIPSPPHLKLTNVFESEGYELMSIIRCWLPPKTLHLEMHPDADVGPCSGIDAVLTCISDACPKMEALSLSMPCDDYESDSEEDECFPKTAQRLISLARQNRNRSRCKSMKLRGSQAFQLLEKAHPEATIELDREGSTFRDEGDGFYALALEVEGDSPPPEADLSRLAELSIRGDRTGISQPWQRVIRTAKLKRIYLEMARVVTFADIRADVVVIPLWNLCEIIDEREADYISEYLKWLSHGARELRIIKSRCIAAAGRVVDFLKTLTFVLDAFGGKVLWMDTLQYMHARSEKDRAYRVRPAFRAARRALDGFEERGGDAGTVRAELAGILWSGSPRTYLRVVTCR